jgi:hypothetical protein
MVRYPRQFGYAAFTTELQCAMSPDNRKKGNRQRFFEIANGNLRQVCSLKTKFLTQHQASRYLRQNWNRIERMARDCLAKERFGDGRFNLVMI